MKNFKKTIILFLALLPVVSFSQECLNVRSDFLPNEVDSNNFYYYVSGSFIFPSAKSDPFQKSVLRKDAQKGNRLMKAEMEMLYFTKQDYDDAVLPHVFLRVDVFPSYYLSSRFGAGVSLRSISSSFGLFYGTYYRRVPYEANFVTRRKRSFENYNLYGFYFQSSVKHSSFFTSITVERNYVFHSTSLTVGLGDMVFQKLPVLNTLGVVFSSETFTGYGYGLCVNILPSTRLDISYTTPFETDVFEQARLQNKLAPGVMIGFSHCVN